MKAHSILISCGLISINLLSIFPLINPSHVAANTMLPSAQSKSLVTGVKWQGTSFPIEVFQGYTSLFGYRDSVEGGSKKEFHLGLDIRSPRGSYIRSWKNGKVLGVFQDPACGISIQIESNDWIHQYCHLEGGVEERNGERFLVDRVGGLEFQEGQSVEAGTRIGRVGMSGRTTGPHLHWGLMYQEQWVDPGVVLREMYFQQSNEVLPRQHM